MVARAACALDDFKAYCALKKRAEERETWALQSTAPSGMLAETSGVEGAQPQGRHPHTSAAADVERNHGLSQLES